MIKLRAFLGMFQQSGTQTENNVSTHWCRKYVNRKIDERKFIKENRFPILKF